MERARPLYDTVKSKRGPASAMWEAGFHQDYQIPRVRHVFKLPSRSELVGKSTAAMKTTCGCLQSLHKQLYIPFGTFEHPGPPLYLTIGYADAVFFTGRPSVTCADHAARDMLPARHLKLARK